ncbi:hypothetical protein LWC34_05410 [Kibdelosporangium philippinense]|uniref:Uncharacterized protein n=1 Tax=Kibdelosporangium philippinense TaxID=211113 RepID=A0ABS8Z6R7_9PSEU|nr:hypothetical protein [Kibdelosporangium philippinense]MCE7002268.1 hypothetical protein [Kibdelosporangium philippinense]
MALGIARRQQRDSEAGGDSFECFLGGPHFGGDPAFDVTEPEFALRTSRFRQCDKGFTGELNGGVGIVFADARRVIATLALDLDATGRIAAIHNVANPDKLGAVTARVVREVSGHCAQHGEGGCQRKSST